MIETAISAGDTAPISSPIGAWNGVMLVMACLFGLSKLVENIHTAFNRKDYVAYVEKLKADDHIL